MDIAKVLQNEFSLNPNHVENVINLIDEGNTIPFIARYRKEMTGSMDDQILRAFFDRLQYLRNLEERRETVKNSINEQEKLTDEIVLALDKATTLAEIEDIYRPFKPKRRTRAIIAKEKGLEPLATEIMLQMMKTEPIVEAEKYINEEKEVTTAQDALNGAMDIIAEIISDDADNRAMIRKATFASGLLSVKAVDDTAQSVYEMYYDYSEPVKKVAQHRVLAIDRGEKEKILSVKIEAPVDEIYKKLEHKIITGNQSTADVLKAVIDDSYKRLISPAIEREIRNELTEQAQIGAISVFGKNLKQLLLQPPIKDKTVLALDPGFRTGCKVAVVDGTGKVLDVGVIYPVPPHNKVAQAEKIIETMVDKYNVDIIAIGNGTASRETEMFTVNLIKKNNWSIQYIIVNEAGASVYSASKLGAEEFPDYDVALRSAVSLARRLQDPLAELVKIDPKSIGVGQYQHDMNQKRLSEALGGVVEDCVNSVGVDLNTASPSLLSYVSGISSAISKNIVAYREENGKFKTRKQILKVAKLGPKAFEQCAGFLRITDGDEPLDNTGVHPESYDITKQYITKLGYSIDDIKEGIKIKDTKNLNQIAKELNVGLPTLQDIVKEIQKPGRDPRDEMPKPILKSDVLSIEDLKEGMVLKGTVRNVIDFGAFVDIGVHQDGLVHISQICDRYIKHPLEALSVGDIVDVKIMSVDVKKNRISLTMKL